MDLDDLVAMERIRQLNDAYGAVVNKPLQQPTHEEWRETYEAGHQMLEKLVARRRA